MMSRKVSRRAVLAGSAAAAALTRFPAPAIAQAAPFKLGLLTVKTGPLAQGGIQMEQGVLTFLKEKNYTMSGRKVPFISAVTGGSMADIKTYLLFLLNKQLQQKKENVDAQPSGGRQPYASPAQSVSAACIGDVLAGDASDGPLRSD